MRVRFCSSVQWESAGILTADSVTRFDLVFCDPPYGLGLGERALKAAATGGWLQPGAVCVLEEAGEAEVVLPAGFTLEDERQIASSRLHLLSHAP